MLGELRIADALDVGKKRVQRNTQGESKEDVIDRLGHDPSDKSKAKLSHWYGHDGIRGAIPKKERGGVRFSFDLDEKGVEEHGGDVAYRVKDTLRDVNTTFAKGNYTVEFTSQSQTK